MDISATATKLVQDNLLLVFGEHDAPKRLAAIKKIWSPSEQSVFVEPEATFRGHAAISAKVGELLKQSPDRIFKEIG